MPYIKQFRRKEFDAIFDKFKCMVIEDKGSLEYCVFKLMKKYMKDKEERYSTLHDCTYAVQHCADEFRRRYLDKREDHALTENGDIS
jgi:hypothetical protein